MNQPSHTSPGERLTVVLAVLLMTVVAVQPAFVTRDPNRQSEMAWEMYAKSAPRDEFVIVREADRLAVTVTDIQPRGLATVDYTLVLPAFICEKFPEASSVETMRGGQLMSVYRCER